MKEKLKTLKTKSRKILNQNERGRTLKLKTKATRLKPTKIN